MDEQVVASATRRWLETFVVGMGLCPFAAAPLAAERVRVVVTEADDEEALLEALQAEIVLLDQQPQIETTLLIHPAVLQDFLAYNDFLDLADALLVEGDRDGVYQVASFHPDYQFAGTAPNAAENYTNRSPYPMLHLLRETSVEKAVASGIDTNDVPVRNIQHMNELGEVELARLLSACREEG
ncbi:MAG: DUF1415 domain-containing protein [Pseudomonadota bacterium]